MKQTWKRFKKTVQEWVLIAIGAISISIGAILIFLYVLFSLLLPLLPFIAVAFGIIFAIHRWW